LAFTLTCRSLETLRYVREHDQEYREYCKATLGVVYREVTGQKEAADYSGQLPDIFTGLKPRPCSGTKPNADRCLGSHAVQVARAWGLSQCGTEY